MVLPLDDQRVTGGRRRCDHVDRRQALHQLVAGGAQLHLCDAGNTGNESIAQLRLGRGRWRQLRKTLDTVHFDHLHNIYGREKGGLVYRSIDWLPPIQLLFLDFRIFLEVFLRSRRKSSRSLLSLELLLPKLLSLSLELL